MVLRRASVSLLPMTFPFTARTGERLRTLGLSEQIEFERELTQERDASRLQMLIQVWNSPSSTSAHGWQAMGAFHFFLKIKRKPSALPTVLPLQQETDAPLISCLVLSHL